MLWVGNWDRRTGVRCRIRAGYSVTFSCSASACRCWNRICLSFLVSPMFTIISQAASAEPRQRKSSMLFSFRELRSFVRAILAFSIIYLIFFLISLVFAVGPCTAITKPKVKRLKIRLVISVDTVFSRCFVRAACVSFCKELHLFPHSPLLLYMFETPSCKFLIVYFQPVPKAEDEEMNTEHTTSWYILLRGFI